MRRAAGGKACPALPLSCFTNARWTPQIVTDADGVPLYAEPFMQFQYGLNGSVTTPCLMQMTTAAVNSYKPSSLVVVPCVNGTQTWTGYNVRQAVWMLFPALRPDLPCALSSLA